jgi:hypothetical protein
MLISVSESNEVVNFEKVTSVVFCQSPITNRGEPYWWVTFFYDSFDGDDYLNTQYKFKTEERFLQFKNNFYSAFEPVLL